MRDYIFKILLADNLFTLSFIGVVIMHFMVYFHTNNALSKYYFPL